MELVRFSCPGCGAELPARDPSGEQSCDYCGSRFAPESARGAKTVGGVVLDHAQMMKAIEASKTELALVQRKLARLRKREAKAEARASEQALQAKAKTKKKKNGKGVWGWVTGALSTLFGMLALGAGMIGIGIALGDLKLEDIPILRDMGFAQRLDAAVDDAVHTEVVDPWGGPPQFTEIDGRPAVVLRTLKHGEDARFVDAYALDDGSRLWRLGPLSSSPDGADHVRFAVVGPLVVVSTGEHNEVWIYDKVSTQRVRSVDVGARVNALCALPETQSVYVHVDGRRHRHQLVELAAGTSTRARKRPEGCSELELERGDPSWLADDAVRDRLDEVELLRVHMPPGAASDASNQAGDSSVGFGVGRDQDEAHAPLLLGLELGPRSTASADGVRWQVGLAEPEGVRDWPAASTLDGGFAYLVWVDAGGWQLASYDLGDGSQRWATTLDAAGDRTLSVHVEDGNLLVVRSHIVEIRAADTGALVAQIGEQPGD